MQLAEYEKRIQHLEQNIAKLKKHLAEGERKEPRPKAGSQGKARHIAHAEGWQAVCTAPDFCKVGKDVVAFNSFAKLDQMRTASPNVKARGTAIYRQGDLLQNVQADAGKHLVSGTSLGSGHVKILDGHANVKVNGVPVARHNSRCLINCDASGVGGAHGKLVTEQKAAGAAPPPVESTLPPGQRTSAKLEALKKAREEVAAGMLNFDALDEYVNFEQTNEVLDGLIKNIRADPDTGADYAAQAARGVLGFAKDFAFGVGELAYEGIKAAPKLARLTSTASGRLHAQLDAQILAENIRLDNITAGSVGQSALDIGKAIVAPVKDPWEKGQYVESVTRASTEVFAASLGWLKGSKAARAANAAKAERAGAKSASADAVIKAETSIAPRVLVHADDGVHVVRAAKPAFSGDWENYKTHGLNKNPILSPEGRRMVMEFEKQGLGHERAVAEASQLIKSGSSLPIAKTVDIGDKFYKVITEGAAVGEKSAFWATKEEVLALKGMSYDQIASKFGMPLISQQGSAFQVVEVTALRQSTSFTSVIARTTEVGANGTLWSQKAGGVQSLLIDRSAFSSPITTAITFP